MLADAWAAPRPAPLHPGRTAWLPRALALVGLLCAARPAMAQDTTAQAKEHFHHAATLYREARYKEAIDEFQAAYRLRPHGVIFFNLAQCYERLGDLPAAIRSYREYLRQVPAADDRKTVEVAIKNLTARLDQSGATTLFVYSLPPGASVSIDGHERGVTPFSADLTPGTYQVACELEGYSAVNRAVEATAGKQLELDITLDKVGSNAPVVLAPDTSAPPKAEAKDAQASNAITAQAAPAPAESHSRLWTWVAGGVAVAGAATGAVFGELSASNASTLHSSPHQQPQVQSLHDTAANDAVIANVAYTTAGVAAVGAVALFFIEGSF